MNAWLNAVVLWVHLLSAVLFVGGSFFMWLVVEPASYRITTDEAARTLLVGRIARQFARFATPLLILLVATSASPVRFGGRCRWLLCSRYAHSCCCHHWPP